MILRKTGTSCPGCWKTSAAPDLEGRAEEMSDATLAEIRLPAEVWNRLNVAAERFSATALEEELKELEKGDREWKELATRLRLLAGAGDFDAVGCLLKQI